MWLQTMIRFFVASYVVKILYYNTLYYIYIYIYVYILLYVYIYIVLTLSHGNMVFHWQSRLYVFEEEPPHISLNTWSGAFESFE